MNAEYLKGYAICNVQLITFKDLNGLMGTGQVEVPTYLCSKLCFTFLQFPVWIRVTLLRFEFQSATCCLYQRIWVFNFRVHFQDLKVSCTICIQDTIILFFVFLLTLIFFAISNTTERWGGQRGRVCILFFCLILIFLTRKSLVKLVLSARNFGIFCQVTWQKIQKGTGFFLYEWKGQIPNFQG